MPKGRKRDDCLQMGERENRRTPRQHSRPRAECVRISIRWALHEAKPILAQAPMRRFGPPPERSVKTLAVMDKIERVDELIEKSWEREPGTNCE